MDAHEANASRYEPGRRSGFYESYFQRANHPDRPLAFWIRYTLFSPARRPQDAIGELWAVLFDGETGQHTVAKQELPLTDCSFDRQGLDVTIGDALLRPGTLSGSIKGSDQTLGWNLTFAGDQPPLVFLPRALYDKPLPKAKSVVARPLVRYSGTLTAGDRDVPVDDWVGSQNHNWGTRHTDSYAWGQVAGFDDHPETFLEVATGRLKFGPLWTPPMTPVVLRHRGQEIRLNSIRQTRRAHGAWDDFTWRFRSEDAGTAVEGEISAPPEAFVGLRYYNPPGGDKHCLNTKVARCQLRVRHPDGTVESLHSAHRAAFEIVTDDRDHGIAIRA